MTNFYKQQCIKLSNHFIFCWWFCQVIPTIAYGCREIIFAEKYCKHSQAQLDTPRITTACSLPLHNPQPSWQKTNSWLVVLKLHDIGWTGASFYPIWREFCGSKLPKNIGQLKPTYRYSGQGKTPELSELPANLACFWSPDAVSGGGNVAALSKNLPTLDRPMFLGADIQRASLLSSQGYTKRNAL